MKFELKNVNLSFGKSVIFENLNMMFQGPGVIGILGPSGCGKSTLIRLLSGLQSPTYGSVYRESKAQGFVFQESHLLNWRNTFENIALPLELKKSKDKNEEKVMRALKAVGLEKAALLFPSQLSGGMKMRASLARAFVTEPDVLFCDEPFSALDELTRENLQADLRNQVEARKSTCFFVTHSLSEALIVSDQIYIFQDQGQLNPDPFQVQRLELSKFRDSALLNQQLQVLREKVRGRFS